MHKSTDAKTSEPELGNLIGSGPLTLALQRIPYVFSDSENHLGVASHRLPATASMRITFVVGMSSVIGAGDSALAQDIVRQITPS